MAVTVQVLIIIRPYFSYQVALSHHEVHVPISRSLLETELGLGRQYLSSSKTLCTVKYVQYYNIIYLILGS